MKLIHSVIMETEQGQNVVPADIYNVDCHSALVNDHGQCLTVVMMEKSCRDHLDQWNINQTISKCTIKKVFS